MYAIVSAEHCGTGGGIDFRDDGVRHVSAHAVSRLSSGMLSLQAVTARQRIRRKCRISWQERLVDELFDEGHKLSPLPGCAVVSISYDPRRTMKSGTSVMK